jgi:galactokinase
MSAGLPPVGFAATIASDLPPGSGLASSAALDVAVALAALAVTWETSAAFPRALEDPLILAGICRDAEADAAGVRCGIMDPYVSLAGRADGAVLLDCRTLAAGRRPIDPGRLALVVLDSGVRHSLAEGEYGRRREECERAAAALGVASLRDAAEADLRELPELLLRRARHVVTENDRTLRAADALRAGDVETLGRLLDESHESLARDFEVSCEELDRIVETAREVDGVYGARMTGGGFGGYAVAACRPEAVPALVREVDGRFDDGSARRVMPSGGARVAVGVEGG